ncbi:MAG: 4-(cytidine 5'-diphospho)-2-C-methyl-D-erythritol kinase [Bacteroidia bacterium]
MVDFSYCKINLGLNVVSKRSDGFHNIETVFYPVNWREPIEVLESTDNEQIKLNLSGKSIEGELKNNIIVKTFLKMQKIRRLPKIAVYLHKLLPMGAGLGGGSSNAATFINLLDRKFNLKLNKEEKINIAKEIGSDCAFFIEGNPVFAKGKGDEFETIKINLDAYYILIVYPNLHSNTKVAYEGVIPQKPERGIKDIIENVSIENWKNFLFNDFEKSIFKVYPEIEKLKSDLYEHGAVYVSMSGSGSAVYGIFNEEPEIILPRHYTAYLQVPK